MVLNCLAFLLDAPKGSFILGLLEQHKVVGQVEPIFVQISCIP